MSSVPNRTSDPPATATPTRNRWYLALELFVNLFLPWLAYRLTQPAFGEFQALIASSIPPLLWSIIEFLRHRRLDALSALILGGIALSVIAMLMSGDARLLLVRESMISGLVGVIFLVSALIRRPLIPLLARAAVHRAHGKTGVARFRIWSQSRRARRALSVMTWVWGAGLVLEAVVRSWLALTWDPERFLAIAPPLGYAFMLGLSAWTFWYVRRLRHK